MVGRSPRRGWAGVVGLSEGGTPGKVYPLGTQAEAAQAFGKEDNLTQLVQVCMANGAARVLAVPVADSSGYAAAFALLAAEEENLKVVVCDSETLTVQQALRDHAASAASDDRRERIAVVRRGRRGDGDPADHPGGQGLNSERVVLVAPGGDGPGRGRPGGRRRGRGHLPGRADPARPLGRARRSRGSAVWPPDTVRARWTPSSRGGVTPVELVGGCVLSVVRGVTTRTKTGEAADATWRELTTILRGGRRDPQHSRRPCGAKFRRAKNTEPRAGGPSAPRWCWSWRAKVAAGDHFRLRGGHRPGPGERPHGVPGGPSLSRWPRGSTRSG